MELLFLPLLLLGALITTFDVADSDSTDTPEWDDSEGSPETSSPGFLADVLNADEEDEEDESTAEHHGDEDPNENVIDDQSSENAQAYGGNEDSFVVLGQEKDVAYGGGGNDVFLKSGGGSATIEGGDGGDSFLISEIFANSEDVMYEQTQTIRVTDYNSEEDSIGLVFESDNIGDLTISSLWNPDANATDVRVFQESAGTEPSSMLIAHFQLVGIEDFNPEDLKFFAGHDITPLNFNLEGTALDDTISGGHPSGSSVAMGYAGNDVIIIRDGIAFGGAGDDVLGGGETGRGAGQFHGESGNDSLSGVGQLFGGSGNDILSLSALSVSHEFESQSLILSGIAVGGDGDDTIIAGAQSVDFEHGGEVIISDGAHLDGGAGNDFIDFTHGLKVDAGAGNDFVVYEATWDTSQEAHSFIVLGSGNDSMYLKPSLGKESIHADIDDFDPSEDKLGIIVTEAMSRNIKIAVSYDPVKNSTRIEFDNGIDDVGRFNSITLQNFDGRESQIDVRLFADMDAALEDMPYRVL